MARILVTGVTGQIGSFVAEQLLRGGHEVLGSTAPDGVALPPDVRGCGLLTAESVDAVVDACGKLDAVVHLAGFSSAAASWEHPVETFAANASMTAAFVARLAPTKSVVFVHASSAEIFGRAAAPMQNEMTPIAPISPYGVSKAAAHMMVRVGREGYRAPMSNLVFFLGESERRPPTFVFRKITRGLAAVKLGLAKDVALGDTSIVRDFSHARDLADAAVRLALGAPPGDYVCGSGEGHAIHEIATAACALLDLDPSRVLRRDPSLVRPVDVRSLVGDAARLRATGWRPSLSFHELVATLTEFDLASLRGEQKA